MTRYVLLGVAAGLVYEIARERLVQRAFNRTLEQIRSLPVAI